MRKFIIIAALAAVLALPAMADWRLDIGVIVPRGVGLSSSGGVNTDLDILNKYIIPLPEAGIYYKGDIGGLQLGIGARAFTFILETIAWPNAYAELNIGPVAIEAQIGGGAFALFGVTPTTTGTGKVFIPDVSAWFKLGKKGTLRLGGGAIGLYIPSWLGDSVPFLFYLGGKAAIGL